MDEYKSSIFSGFTASPPPVFTPHILFISLCVHSSAFLCNFGRSLDCTSVLAWYLALVDYCLLQLNRAIYYASELNVIACL